MATFKRTTITDKGRSLISKSLSNETKINFTRFESTEFIYNDFVDTSKVLRVDNPVQNVKISEITRKNEKVMLRAIFTNENILNTYKINAIGIYAKDDSDNEILFALLIADNPDTIEKQQGQIVTSITIDLFFVLSDKVNVSLTVNNNAIATIQTINEFKSFVETNYVKNIDFSTEQKNGIAKIYSETESESTAEKVKEVVKAGNGDTQEVVNERPTGETVWSKLIKTLDHTKILSVRGLVKILSKFLKPATENEYGLVNFQTIKQVSPKPDLSPYIPFSKGYRNNNNSDFVIRCNNTDCWAPRHLYMYLENGDYMGCFHVNGGRAYYKVPNRNGGNWCEIMDNHDMAARDNRMNVIDGNVNAARGRADDAWNRTQDLYNLRNNDNNDKWQNYIRDIRLAGFMELPLWGANTSTERGGYVVTGIRNHDANSVLGTGDYAQLRALQFFRNGQWLNIGFA